MDHRLALDPSGNPSSGPSDTSSSRLSRNCCALPSGHTSTHPPGPRQLSPPQVIPVLAAYSNPGDLPPVLTALAPPAMPALALSSVGHEPARDEPRGRLELARFARGAGSARLVFGRPSSSRSSRLEPNRKGIAIFCDFLSAAQYR